MALPTAYTHKYTNPHKYFSRNKNNLAQQQQTEDCYEIQTFKR